MIMEDAHPRPAHFDRALGAWVLSSHEDVGAALRDPRLNDIGCAGGVAAHRQVRDAMARELSSERIDSWRAELERGARERAAALPKDSQVDLLAAFAAPWALELAVRVTGARAADAVELARLARRIFLAAAVQAGAAVSPESHAPAAELARRLPPAQAAMHVQTFVALSQTLPHLLGAMWLELFSQAEAAERLRAKPHLPASATEELLRLASPSRAVFRHALADVRIGQAAIRDGERVILRLAAANRDGGHYAEPDRLDIERGARDHHGFGGGTHACAGARIVRAAAAIATEALLCCAGAVELVGAVTWVDGFSIRAPASLPAVLRALPTPRLEA